MIFKISAGFLMGALVLLAVALSFSQYFLGEGLRLSATGDLRGALEAVRLSARLNPFDPEPLENQSFIFQQQEEYEAAAGSLREAIERDPNNYSPRLLLGHLQARGLRDLDAAVESYRGALELNPNASGASSALARILTRQGKLEEAKKEYERLDEGGRVPYLGLYDLGRIYVRTGEPREGLRAIERSRRRAEAQLRSLDGPLEERQRVLVRSMNLSAADALVVLGRHGQAREVLEGSTSEQAPALLELLNSDPEAYREQVLNSDVY